MRIIIYSEKFRVDPYPDKPTVGFWAACFKEGLEHHGVTGIETREAEDLSDYKCDLSVVWGLKKYPRVIAFHKRTGTNFILIERGFVPPRHKWTAVGFNGLNGLGNYMNSNMPSDRWDKHHSERLMPWNPAGKHVLIVGQTKGDASLCGLNYLQWVEDTKEYFHKRRIPYVFRPHPGPKVTFLNDVPDFNEAVDEAKCVVTYSSNGAVTSVLRGKPTITLHPVSMAWDVTAHSLDDWDKHYMPDRTQWTHNLAYTQWLAHEIASGECWAHLKKFYD